MMQLLSRVPKGRILRDRLVSRRVAYFGKSAALISQHILDIAYPSIFIEGHILVALQQTLRYAASFFCGPDSH